MSQKHAVLNHGASEPHQPAVHALSLCVYITGHFFIMCVRKCVRVRLSLSVVLAFGERHALLFAGKTHISGISSYMPYSLSECLYIYQLHSLSFLGSGPGGADDL